MKRTMRWLGWSAVMAMAAVSCSPPPAECTIKSARFVSPTEGATVNPQVDVQVEGLNADGQPVALDDAKLTVRPVGAAPKEPISGTIASNVATFAMVSLQSGSSILSATVREKDTQCSVTADVGVSARTTSLPATVAAVSFPQDANNDGVLNLTEWPMGAPLRVQVVGANVSGMQVQVKQASDVRGGPIAFVMDRATVDLTQLPDTTSGTVQVFAEILSAGVAQNTSAGNPTANGSIRVSRVRPTCANTTKLNNGPSDDADGSQAGFQLLASGTVGADVSAVTFRVVGASSVNGVIAAGVASGQLSLGAMGDQTYEVVLDARDAAGNTCSDSKMVRVDLAAPTVQITAPARNDAGVITTTASSLMVTATSDSPTGMMCFFRKFGTAARTQVGCATVTNGMATQVVTFPMNGSFELTVDATDEAGNVGTSAPVTVNVTLAGCAAGFTAPATCPVTLFAQDLTAGSYTTTLASSNCGGRSARIKVDGTVRISAALTTMGTLTGSVPLTAGAHTLRGEVDNQQGGVDSVDCAVTVDLSTPSITNPVGPGPVIINTAQDLNGAVAGAQRNLTFSGTIPMGGRADVCTTQATDPVTSQARVACPDGAMGWYLLSSGVVSPVASFTYPEGTYSVKVVLVSGMSTNVGAALPLVVDVTRPCLTAAGVRADRDDGAGVMTRANDGKLNIAEYAQTSPFLSFVVGCGDTQATLDSTTPVALKQVVAGVLQPLGVGTPTVTFAAGRANIALAGLTGDTTRTYFVELKDQNGNTSAFSGAMDPAAKTLQVDLQAPTCSITTPSATSTLLGTMEVMSGSLNVAVATSSDVVASGLSLALTGPTTPAVQNLVLANGVASGSFAVSGDNMWSLSATCADAVGNSVTATPWAGRIDLVAPTCAFVAPTPGANITSGATVTTTLNVGGANGQSVSIRSSLQPSMPIGSLPVVNGVATGALAFPESAMAQTATATVSDTARNVCTTTVSFTYQSANCSLVLTGAGLKDVGNDTYYANAGYSSSTIAASSTDCGNGQTVTLVRTTPAGTPTTAQTSGGTVSFNQATADGEVYTLTINNGTGLLTTKTLRVDRTPPTFAGFTLNGVSTFPAMPATLTFVASTTNRNVRAATANYFADQGVGAGAQIVPVIVGAAGVIGGVAEVLLDTTPVAGGSQALTADGDINFTTQPTLPQNSTGTLTIRVTDIAGNTATMISRPVVVDVVAPSQVALATPSVPRGAAGRAGRVDLSWAAVGDDGSTGTPAGYEVVWTTSSIPNNNELSAESDYFGTAVVAETNSLGSATSRTLKLPPINKYYIAVRAIDEVGNLSPFVAPPAGASAVSNLWRTITLSDATANSAYGSDVNGASDLNGDGVRDLVVSAPGVNPGTDLGAAFVYFGGAALSDGGTTLVDQPTCTAMSTQCQKILPPASSPGNFGSDIDTGGDIDGDGRNDLVVAQPNFTGAGTTRIGRVVVYFGTASGKLDEMNFLEFRGDGSNLNFGATARFVGDLNGDGKSDLAVAATGWDLTNTDLTLRRIGRVYVFAGRARASFPANPIALTDARWIVNGPTPRLDATGAAPSNAFATFHNGFVKLGDVNGDGQPDFTIPMSRQTICRVQLWSGRTLHDPSVMNPTLPIVAPSSTTPYLGGTINTQISLAGFGFAALGSVDFNGDGGVPVNDLVISHPNTSLLALYSDLSLAATTTATQIFGQNSLGGSLAAADLNQDGQLDLIAGETGFAPTNGWVLYQKPTGGFGTGYGTARNEWSSTIKSANSTGRLGSAAAAFDLTGDGATAPDLILADNQNQTVTVIW